MTSSVSIVVTKYWNHLALLVCTCVWGWPLGTEYPTRWIHYLEGTDSLSLSLSLSETIALIACCSSTVGRDLWNFHSLHWHGIMQVMLKQSYCWNFMFHIKISIRIWKMIILQKFFSSCFVCGESIVYFKCLDLTLFNSSSPRSHLGKFRWNIFQELLFNTQLR